MGEEQVQRCRGIARGKRRGEFDRVHIRSRQIELCSAADAVGMTDEDDPMSGLGRTLRYGGDLLEGRHDVLASGLSGVACRLGPVVDGALFRRNPEAGCQRGFQGTQGFLEIRVMFLVAGESRENPDAVVRRGCGGEPCSGQQYGEAEEGAHVGLSDNSGTAANCQ